MDVIYVHCSVVSFRDRLHIVQPVEFFSSVILLVVLDAPLFKSNAGITRATQFLGGFASHFFLESLGYV